MKKILLTIQNISKNEWDYKPLVELVNLIRPKSKKQKKRVADRLKELIEILKSNPELRDTFRSYIQHLFIKNDPIHLYIESGIVSQASIIYETFQKIKYRILPKVYQREDMRFVFNEVFWKKNDYKWVQSIPTEIWEQLIKRLGLLCHFPRQDKNNKHFNNFISAIQISSHRIAALGLDPEISSKLPHIDEINSPFLEQNREITFYINTFDENTQIDNDDYKHILVILKQCEENIALLRKKKNSFGASLRLTNLIRRLMQIIRRFKILLLLIHQNDTSQFRKNIVLLFKELVEAENTKYSLRQHFKHSFELMTYQIVEHASKSGRHYIAKDRKEYMRFFLSSLGGGIIVALASIIKINAYDLTISPFGEGLMYSMIYAFCFIGIHLTGSTLATKVPSMTATSIAGVIDEQRHSTNNKKILVDLKELVIKIFRSQFIAFAGNLLAALPFGIAFTFLYYQLYPEAIVSMKKFHGLLVNLHPWQSYSFLFAALAGVYLFISALVTGYYENKIIHDQIPARIIASKNLNWLFGKKFTKRISGYINKNWGAIMGNFALGVFFGISPIIGEFFGIAFETRHIAFATANLGISLFGLEFDIALSQLLLVLLSIFVIGFINFFVSFGLALYTAMRSRKITFTQTRRLIWLLLQHFFRKPWDFFIIASSKKKKTHET